MQRQPGFTILELIITVTILAIVISLAVPPMGEFVRRYRSEAKARELFDLVILMRTRAYSEQQRYTLCPRGIDASCGNDWSSGAILFADPDGDGERDTGETIEKIFSGADSGGSLRWRAFNNSGYITFRPDGTTPAQSGHFAYCPPSGEEEIGWTIILNAIGRPYVGKDKDGDGVRETGRGDNLSCATAPG
ncbi:GspH/FimT family pseudopilin [Microbulbifer celer]|uniref:Type II secretion system protein H n=1 Tax=Microbulbifer celer TaxID=435905 RepID=A0ABW3UB35_9GAMM|nr:GspH/FimT family pseudopilin [Microbulbifer celer]UFN56230.1 GspH/FimT family pseudopilin [Microbulbifer celer]